THAGRGLARGGAGRGLAPGAGCYSRREARFPPRFPSRARVAHPASAPEPRQCETERMATYTHGHHESVLRSHNNRTIANSAEYLRPHLAPGASLLDVGAGPGTITVEL